MSRPKKQRCLQFTPCVFYYKPTGVPLRYLEEVEILPDEIEAVKLHFVDNLDQTKSAQKMCISQSTFARVVNTATKKIAFAIINGKAIRISKIVS